MNPHGPDAAALDLVMVLVIATVGGIAGGLVSAWMTRDREWRRGYGAGRDDWAPTAAPYMGGPTRPGGPKPWPYPAHPEGHGPPDAPGIAAELDADGVTFGPRRHPTEPN